MEMNEQLMDMLIDLAYGEQSRKVDDIDLRIELWKQAGIAKIAFLALSLNQTLSENSLAHDVQFDTIAEQIFISGHLLRQMKTAKK
jgi:hypothetical protein